VIAEAGFDAPKVVEGDEYAEVDWFAALVWELPAVEAEADQVDKRVVPPFAHAAVVIRSRAGHRGVQRGAEHRPALRRQRPAQVPHAVEGLTQREELFRLRGSVVVVVGLEVLPHLLGQPA
jgi:hypothetical protein